MWLISGGLDLPDISEELSDHRKRWEAQARPEQLTPGGDWKTWLLLAGRGFGKTRTAAEDIAWYGLTHPNCLIAVVAETFADARDVCIEGESGLFGVLPPDAIRHWNRSLGELFLTNGTKYKLFSGDKPRGLRGYQHHRMWWDELAKMMYADEAWTQGQLGLRLGINPQNLVTTTPQAIDLIRELVERENVVVTAGSTFDNAANLSQTFLEEVRALYEGTPLGDQELYGQIVSLDGESVFKREWFNAGPAGDSRTRFDPSDDRHSRLALARFAALDTANKAKSNSAYSALVVGELRRDWSLAVRYVVRDRVEFPALRDWIMEELSPWAFDGKLTELYVENMASGVQLVQDIDYSGPEWLRAITYPVEVSHLKGGQENDWREAAPWCRRGMVALPFPHDSVEWLRPFEKELYEVPQTTYWDQATAFSHLINNIQRREEAPLSTGWHYREAKRMQAEEANSYGQARA